MSLLVKGSSDQEILGVAQRRDRRKINFRSAIDLNHEIYHIFRYNMFYGCRVVFKTVLAPLEIVLFHWIVSGRWTFNTRLSTMCSPRDKKTLSQYALRYHWYTNSYIDSISKGTDTHDRYRWVSLSMIDIENDFDITWPFMQKKKIEKKALWAEKMTSQPESVARLVLSTYELFPEKGKPIIRSNGISEWTILAGIVAQNRGS